jgi:DNA transposition AAA+ family ATPase
VLGKRVAAKRIERQLRSVVVDLKSARERVAIAKEHYEAFRDDDEEARMRSLGSDAVADRHVAEQASRHAEVMRHELERAESHVASLERARDELLSRYEPSS